MKIRPLVAVVGVTSLAALVSVPIHFASAAAPNYGNRDQAVSAVAGGGRMGIVLHYAPVNKPSRSNVNMCSIGVPWRLANGTRGFLTSGQCLSLDHPVGTQVVKARSGRTWTPGPILGTRPNNMTTVNEGGTLARTGGDLAFVPSRLPIGNSLFIGGPGSGSRLPITSWASKATGTYTLCFSGFESGSRCGLAQSKATSYKGENEGSVYTQIAEAKFGRGRPGQTCGEAGDRGGVVYRMDPKKPVAYVVGILSGSNGTKYTNWISGCSMYYTPLGVAQKQFGGGPITS